jgi:hypothetical protein
LLIFHYLKFKAIKTQKNGAVASEHDGSAAAVGARIDDYFDPVLRRGDGGG